MANAEINFKINGTTLNLSESEKLAFSVLRYENKELTIENWIKTSFEIEKRLRSQFVYDSFVRYFKEFRAYNELMIIPSMDHEPFKKVSYIGYNKGTKITEVSFTILSKYNNNNYIIQQYDQVFRSSLMHLLHYMRDTMITYDDKNSKNSDSLLYNPTFFDGVFMYYNGTRMNITHRIDEFFDYINSIPYDELVKGKSDISSIAPFIGIKDPSAIKHDITLLLDSSEFIYEEYATLMNHHFSDLVRISINNIMVDEYFKVSDFNNLSAKIEKYSTRKSI